MPHCIVEHSINLSSPLLIKTVYEGACISGLFNDADIKTRALEYEHYQSGSQQQTFVHVTTKILSGRSQEQRSTLSLSILAALESLNLQSTSITVEIVEIETFTYAKVVT